MSQKKRPFKDYETLEGLSDDELDQLKQAIFFRQGDFDMLDMVFEDKRPRWLQEYLSKDLDIDPPDWSEDD